MNGLSHKEIFGIETKSMSLVMLFVLIWVSCPVLSVHVFARIMTLYAICFFPARRVQGYGNRGRSAASARSRPWVAPLRAFPAPSATRPACRWRDEPNKSRQRRVQDARAKDESIEFGREPTW